MTLRRPLLDAVGCLCPIPAGTRHDSGALGGVPTERVASRGAVGPHQVLFLHGGGYQVGSPASHRGFVAHLSRAAGAPVHVPHYRRAPEHPYPAAVDDAEAAYRALRTAGHPAQRIALVGDSAGGGIVMALVLRLREAGEELPGAIGLVSPWLDLGLRSPSVYKNAGLDAMLAPDWLAPAARAYLADTAVPAELRPLEADLAGLPPVHVIAGTDELLLGDADALVERVRAAGGRVGYRRSERMWHDFPLFAGLLREADAAVAELGAVVHRACSGTRRPRVAVVGAGFGGIGIGSALRAAGWVDPADLTILDRAGGVGGVWRANTYPGAGCDAPSVVYSYAAEPGTGWRRRSAAQPEILRYLERVCERGLTPHLRPDTEVTEARWDAARALWRLSLSGGDTLDAEVLVAACGQHSTPALPTVPGLERFTGPAFHSAAWDHDVDLTGARVSVVGTGASAGQIVPAIVDRVGALTVFQRTAPYVLPKPNPAYGARHQAVQRALPVWRRLSRAAWLAGMEITTAALTAGPAVRLPLQLAFRLMLRGQVPDRALRRRLTPGHPLGSRRAVFASDYYAALTRPHVEVVTEAVSEGTPTGLRTADGRVHPADVIVYATGFAPDVLAPMTVVGREGRELRAQWRDGAFAHLGITVPGFPNMFLLHGPNTHVPSGSAVVMLESQIRYVTQAVRLLADGPRSLCVREPVAERFAAEMRRRLARGGGPGGHRANIWPGTMHEYRRRTSRLQMSEFELERVSGETGGAHDR